VNRFCNSGLQAIVQVAHMIVQEGVDVAIGGGVESITMVPRDNCPNSTVREQYPGLYIVMGETAEVVAKRYGIGRDLQDQYALTSQQRTARAQQDKAFDAEIAPIRVTRAIFDKKTAEKTGEEQMLVARDECNRPETTIEALSRLPPVFDTADGKGVVTAGNSSQLADGASATLLMSMERARALAVTPLVRFRGYAVAGCEPDEMGIGPVFAVPKLLKRAGLSIDDVELWELNEAFASQVLYCCDRLRLPLDRVNVNGGSISIGHPFGMTGSRLVGTLAHEMVRRRARYGVVTMCVGGGQGAAALFEACV
jgi:acetyl-CoA acetyltransferase family protein